MDESTERGFSWRHIEIYWERSKCLEKCQHPGYLWLRLEFYSTTFDRTKTMKKKVSCVAREMSFRNNMQKYEKDCSRREFDRWNKKNHIIASSESQYQLLTQFAKIPLPSAILSCVNNFHSRNRLPEHPFETCCSGPRRKIRQRAIFF